MKKDTVNKIRKGAVVGGFFLLALGSLSGCLPPEVAHAEATDTPVATQTINPTNTPKPTPTNVPTPTNTPAPTHEPELSLKEEIALLGGKNDNKVTNLYGILPSFFKFYDEEGNYQYRVMWMFLGSEGNNFGFYDFWSETKIYSLNVKDGMTLDDAFKTKKPANKRFETAEFLEFCGISELKEKYSKYGISWELPPEWEDMAQKGESYIEQYEAPISKLKELYIKFTPKECRFSLKDFDESIVVKPQTTQQQSIRAEDNVIYGHRGMNYFDSTQNAKKYVVNTINRQNNQVKSYQARRI